MICSNCGYDKDQHVQVEGQLLCLQVKGTFRLTLDRMEVVLSYKDEAKKVQTNTHVVLTNDTSRIHNTIIGLLNRNCTEVVMRIGKTKYKEGQKQA